MRRFPFGTTLRCQKGDDSPDRRPVVYTLLMVNVRRAWGLLAILTGLWCFGCDAPQLDMRPGASGIFDGFSGPTPLEAATWATDSYDPNNRYRGTLLLANAPFAGEALYVKLFRYNIKDSDPGVRAAATRALALHGEPADGAFFVEGLRDADASVRVESARGLQRLHYPDAIPALLEVLDSEKESEEKVRIEAALALGQHADPRVVEGLITALADPNLAVNRNTLFSLRVLTGQDYGFDQKSWLLWFRDSKDVFAARGGYMYPAFSRDRTWWEYIPFVKPPPFEPSSTPVGLPTGGEAP